jgi:hypothetical protein
MLDSPYASLFSIPIGMSFADNIGFKNVCHSLVPGHPQIVRTGYSKIYTVLYTVVEKST